MGGVVEFVLGVADPWAYVLVGVLALAEAAALLGLVIPGEMAVLLGGVVVSTGHARLGWMIAVAAAGAVVGDSIGYELGRRFAGPLRTSRLGRRVGEVRWLRAEEYLRTRGGKAVFIGRWIGVLRALVPFVAGASRMPYRIFLPYNVLGGVLWAATFVVAGYLAGNSYRVVAKYAGQASLVLGGLLLLVTVFTLGARWVMGHPERVRSALHRVGGSAPARWIAGRYARQLAFLADRLRPHGAFGLVLSVELAVLVAAGWFFGGVTEDVLARNELIGIDSPVAQFFAVHREPWLTTAMAGVTWLGSARVLAPAALVIATVTGRRLRSWRPLLFLAAVLVGSTVMVQLIKVLIARPRPEARLIEALGYSFPSGHATAAAAGWTAIAVVLALLTGRWRPKVALAATAVLIALVVGVSRVYLGVHEPTDVLGGWALGVAWTAGVAAAMRAYDDRARRKVAAEPRPETGRP